MSLRRRIEIAFECWGHFVVRHCIAVTLAILAGTAVLMAPLPRLRIDNSVEAFLDASDPILLEYNEFRERFGRDHWVIVAIGPGDVFSPAFLERLRDFHAALESTVPHADRIMSLVNARWTYGDGEDLIIEDLFADWATGKQSGEALRERIQRNPLFINTLISDDDTFVAIVIQAKTLSSLGTHSSTATASSTSSNPGQQTRHYITDGELEELVVAVRRVAMEFATPDFQVHLTGAPVVAERTNRAVERDIGVSLIVAESLIVAVLYLLFRHVLAALLPVVVVLLSLLSTLGIMTSLGINLSATTQILPTFLLTVGVCDSVHILSLFYLKIAAGDRREDAIPFALAHAGVAVAVTSLTTAGGLAAFYVAEVAQVSQLGIVAPLGVMLAMVYTISLLPAVLAMLPTGPPALRRTSCLESYIVQVGNACARRPRLVVAGHAMLVLIGVVGASRLRFGQDQLTWFPLDEPVRVATEVVNREFHGLLTLEAVIEAPRNKGFHRPDLLTRLEKLHTLSRDVRHGDLVVGKTLSLVDVVRETHQALNDNDQDHYRVPESEQLIAQELFLFEMSRPDDLADLVDSEYRTTRVSMRVPWVDAVRYPAFVEELRKRFEGILGDSAELRLTGLTNLFARTFTALVTSMAYSYVLALLIIGPLMMLLLGSLRRGALAMIPNLVPLVLTLGFMGWLDVPLDISTLLIGGIIIGLAVDDTIHFTYGFYRDYDRTGDGRGAIHRTLRITGTAMAFTSIVLVAGFTSFMFAYMLHIQMFGFLIAFATAAAFVADVTLTPALLSLSLPSDGDR